jgi:hypothetical protein
VAVVIAVASSVLAVACAAIACTGTLQRIHPRRPSAPL